MFMLLVPIAVANNNTMTFGVTIQLPVTGGTTPEVPPPPEFIPPPDMTDSQLDKILLDIADFVINNPDYDTSDLIDLQLLIEEETGVELTVEDIQALVNTFNPIQVTIGGGGGVGLPPDDTRQACDIIVNPTNILLNADNLAVKFEVINQDSISILPTFGLYPEEDKPSAVDLLSMKGEIKEVVPRDSQEVFVTVNPSIVSQNNGTYHANLRVIIDGCKDIDVPIKVVTGGLFPFLEEGLTFGGKLGSFLKYFFSLFGKEVVNLFGLSIKFWHLFILMTIVFSALLIFNKTVKMKTVNKVIVAATVSGFLTLLLSLILG